MALFIHIRHLLGSESTDAEHGDSNYHEREQDRSPHRYAISNVHRGLPGLFEGLNQRARPHTLARCIGATALHARDKAARLRSGAELGAVLTDTAETDALVINH